MSLTFRSPLVLVALAAVAVAQDAKTVAVQKHLLRIAPSVGTTHTIVQSMDMTTKVGAGERKMEMLQSTKVWIEGKVASVDGGKTTLEQAYKRVKAKANGMANVDFDSDDPESRPGPMGQLADMVGEKIKTVMNDRGAVLDMVLPEGLESASGIDMKQAFAQAVPTMPEEPVAIGESWTTNMDMPMGQLGTLKCKVANKLISVEKGLARMDQTYEFSTEGLQLPGGMNMQVEAGAGFTVVDLSSGLPADSASEITLSMVGGPGGMEMRMGMKMTMKRVDPAAEAAAEAEAKKQAEAKKEAEAKQPVEAKKPEGTGK